MDPRLQEKVEVWIEASICLRDMVKHLRRMPDFPAGGEDTEAAHAFTFWMVDMIALRRRGATILEQVDGGLEVEPE